MKSQPINKFEGVKVELSLDEAIKFVEGNREMRERICDHISGHLSAAGINAVSEVEDPPDPKKTAVKCNICGKMFSARGINIHRKKAHPELFLKEEIDG
jgi:hypothetical protein